MPNRVHGDPQNLAMLNHGTDDDEIFTHAASNFHTATAMLKLCRYRFGIQEHSEAILD